jgi:hypothetical protein
MKEKESVRLAEVVEALEYPEEWECLLDRNTLKIILITDNEEPYLEDGTEDELADLPDWQQESILDVRRALQAADPIPLPSRFDVHEWEIMRRFSDSQEEGAWRELRNAIHGPGAFRMFRHTIDRLGLRESWFSYRDEALKQIARDWLNENGIRFTED